MIQRRSSNLWRTLLLVLATEASLVLEVVLGRCPYDFSALGNFTSLCSRSSSGTMPSAQIVICCEDIYGAAVFAISEHANRTGEMFLSEAEAQDCIAAYETTLLARAPGLSPRFFQRYCPLVAARITRAGPDPARLAPTSCNVATTRQLSELLAHVDGQTVLHNVSRACNQLRNIGQRGCQDCQTQLLDAIARLANLTGDQPAACGTAVAIAISSLHPSVAAFQNFYQCVLEILNGVPIADFLNITTPPALATAPATPATAAAGKPIPVDSTAHSKGSSRRLLIIVGSVVGLVLLACCTLAGLYVLRDGDAGYDFPTGFSGTLLSTSESSEVPVNLPTEGFYIFHLKELTKATNNFSESLVVGEGSAGTVYLGNLPSGKLVAVKRIVKEKKVETFNKEVELLARIRHPNLTALLGYCQAKCAHLLVYEFMSNGDLGKRLLDPTTKPLTWEQRMKIAIDCARGLTYLHECAEGPIIHRDIKPSNILLSESMEAKLSDFGLSRVMEYEASHVSTEIKGTTGYLDPEYLILGQLTEASDVYSFGVVLLQLLSGRKAIDGDSQLNRSLVQLAFMVMNREVEFKELVDPRLGPAAGELESARSLHTMAEVANRCIRPRSYDRPTMSEVLDGLELALRQHQSTNGTPKTPT